MSNFDKLGLAGVMFGLAGVNAAIGEAIPSIGWLLCAGLWFIAWWRHWL